MITSTTNMNGHYSEKHELMFDTRPPMYCMLCLRHLWCYKTCTMSIHFRVIETCVSKTKQLSLLVVLLPKKGANKYSPHIYSLSVTLQHSHLQFRIRSPDHTGVIGFSDFPQLNKAWRMMKIPNCQLRHVGHPNILKVQLNTANTIN